MKQSMLNTSAYLAEQICPQLHTLNLAVKFVVLWGINKANGSKTHSQITEH
jgi:hypothetical protein